MLAKSLPPAALLPIATAAAPTESAAEPIPLRVTAPVSVSPVAIFRFFRAVLPPIIPPTFTVPLPFTIVKISLSVEALVALIVEEKSIVPPEPVRVLTVMVPLSFSRTTAPSISIFPVSEMMSLERVTVEPIKVTFPISVAIRSPLVLSNLRVPVPASNLITESPVPSVPMIRGAISIAPPLAPVSIDKSSPAPRTI